MLLCYMPALGKEIFVVQTSIDINTYLSETTICKYLTGGKYQVLESDLLDGK